MPQRVRLLDLFCGVGGAAMGYHLAGFEVVGVDIAPQPNYPFEFHQVDALEFSWKEFDAIHASPPCQAYTTMSKVWKRDHPDLVAETRDYLTDSGLPWVIENVPGAPVWPDIVLCGTQFGLGANGRELRRHRLFESNFALTQDEPCRHETRPLGVYGHGGGQQTRGYMGTADECREAMGIDWGNRDEVGQAIPPAFTEFIGHQLMEAV